MQTGTCHSRSEVALISPADLRCTAPPSRLRRRVLRRSRATRRAAAPRADRRMSASPFDRLAGRLRDRRPEILGRALPYLNCCEVGVDALAERLVADLAFDHAQHGGALLVGDRVEQLVDLGRRFRLRADGRASTAARRAAAPPGSRDFVQLRCASSAFHALSGLFSIQLANPSFSQMSSHHCIVTRSPNHWCAISCASTSRDQLLPRADRAPSSDRRAAASRGRRSPRCSPSRRPQKSGTATIRRRPFAVELLTRWNDCPAHTNTPPAGKTTSPNTIASQPEFVANIQDGKRGHERS